MNNFDDQQLLSGMKWYISALVTELMAEEKEKFREEVSESLKYLADERDKLNKIAHQLDKYITTGGELKDGKTVKDADNMA